MSALRLFALMLLLAGTWYMVLVIVDVIEEDFLSGRLPRSNLFLDSSTSLTRVLLEFLTGAPGTGSTMTRRSPPRLERYFEGREGRDVFRFVFDACCVRVVRGCMMGGVIRDAVWC